MRALHAFRHPRGAGGEQHCRGGEGRQPFDRRQRPRIRLRRPFGADDPQLAPETGSRDAGDVLGFDQYVPGTRHREDMTQRVTAEGGVQRHRDGTEPGAPEDQIDRLDAVRGHRGDGVTTPDPATCERPGHGARAVHQFAVGHSHVVHPQRGVVTASGGTVEEQCRDRHRVRQRQCPGHIVTERRRHGRRPCPRASAATRRRCRRAGTAGPRGGCRRPRGGRSCRGRARLGGRSCESC